MNNNPSLATSDQLNPNPRKVYNNKKGVKGFLGRITGLKGEGNHITLIQGFVRCWIDYIKTEGISIASVEDKLRQSGKINIYTGKLSQMGAGEINPYTYAYSMQVLAEAVGKNVCDFVSFHQPEEKEAVRAVIKNPDCM